MCTKNETMTPLHVVPLTVKRLGIKNEAITPLHVATLTDKRGSLPYLCTKAPLYVATLTDKRGSLKAPLYVPLGLHTQ